MQHLPAARRILTVNATACTSPFSVELRHWADARLGRASNCHHGVRPSINLMGGNNPSLDRAFDLEGFPARTASPTFQPRCHRLSSGKHQSSTRAQLSPALNTLVPTQGVWKCSRNAEHSVPLMTRAKDFKYEAHVCALATTFLTPLMYHPPLWSFQNETTVQIHQESH